MYLAIVPSHGSHKPHRLTTSKDETFPIPYTHSHNQPKKYIEVSIDNP